VDENGNGRHLRIVSANLWNGRADPAAFAELVDRLQADAVAVQELTERQAAALTRVVPHGRLEPRGDFLGMGVALRRPGRVRRLRLPYRDAWLAEAHANGSSDGDGMIEIINVHVRAPHSPPTVRAFLNRRGQVRGLERHLETHPDLRRVLIGDLNATPLWPAYRRLRARLIDAAVAAAEQNSHRPQPTWGPWPSAPRLLRIDHALVSGLVVREFRVLPVVGADHSAIVVDLALP
jgi:endonuclease/exonuclease/phosphatase (EEP) superfamily protein YafD